MCTNVNVSRITNFQIIHFVNLFGRLLDVYITYHLPVNCKSLYEYTLPTHVYTASVNVRFIMNCK